MHRYMKFLTPFLLTIMIMIGLSACGTSLEKPTGLEETDHKHVELDTKDRLDKKEIKTANTEEAESAENDQEKASEKESTVDEKKQATDKKDNKKTTENQSRSVEKKEHSTSNDQNTKKSTGSSSKDKPKEQPKKSAPPKEKSEEQANNKQDTKSTITHSIVITSSEVPLPATKMEITDEDTVLQALIAITMANNIHMDYRGGQGATAYVQGMGNVYEFDRGQGSGWMYRINGIFPDRGAGVVPLCDGDTVEWLYTTDLGVDLGADLKPVRRDGKCP